MQQEDEAPDCFRCQITDEIMEDPVLLVHMSELQLRNGYQSMILTQ